MIFQIALVLYLLINYLLINKQAVACIKSLFHLVGCMQNGRTQLFGFGIVRSSEKILYSLVVRLHDFTSHL